MHSQGRLLPALFFGDGASSCTRARPCARACNVVRMDYRDTDALYSAPSVELDSCRSNDLGPGHHFLRQQAAELFRRSSRRLIALVEEKRLDIGLLQDCVEVLVQRSDELSWRFGGRDD